MVSYNIIVELMNDGAGDYAYTIYLIDLLLKMGINQQDIRIVYINTFDYGYDLNTIVHDKLKSNIELLQCNVIDEKNISAARTQNPEIIKYTFKPQQNIIGTPERKEVTLYDINTTSGKLYNFNTTNLTPVDFNNTFNIINNLVNAFKFPEDNVQIGDTQCTVQRTQLDTNNIKLTELYDLSVKQPGFPIDRIGNLLFNKYPSINIIYMYSLILYEGEDLNNKPLFSQAINIVFRTQPDNNIYNFKNLISIREGGHSSNNSFNCSINHGYIKAKVEGNLDIFNTYCINNNIIPENSHVCYISPSSDNDIPKKLSKFVKILGYTNEIKNNHKILMLGNWDKLFSDISIKDPRMQLHSDICRGGIIGNEVTLIFNNKNIIVKNVNPVNLNKDGFNFAFLLQHTNPYCLLSGDTSYMEGLTLGKKAIHIGMINKYNMINQLNGKIIWLIDQNEFGSINNYEYIDNTGNITEFNKLIKLYSKFLEHPQYLNIQNELTQKDFDETLIEEINKKRNQAFQVAIPYQSSVLGPMNGGSLNNYYKNKYLKYKNKYLNLKKINL
jgi:hypothetical protein